MKKNNTCTLLSLLLVTLFIVSAFSGCGKTVAPTTPTTPTTPGTSATPTVPVTSVVLDPVIDLPDEKYTFEWSDGGTKKGVTYYGANVFTDYVTQKTNENINFNLHFESELFGPPVEIEAIKSGEIDFAGVHHAFAGSVSPLIEFLSGVGARGVFDGLEHYWRFIDTPQIREMVENEMATKFNCKLLWLAPVSNSIIASTKPIHTVEDFQGVQLRTPGTASANAYSLLGANPVSLSASELYMGLERGVIQAADTGSDEVFYKMFYEVTPYLTVDYTVYSPHALVSINLDLWNSLPKQYQEIMLEAAAEAEKLSREFIVSQNEELIEALTPLVEEIFFFPEEEVAKAKALLYENTKNTFFSNNDPTVAETVWNILEEARNG